MDVNVAIGVLEGCAFSDLDDETLLHRLLDEAVAAGRFTELHRYVHRFEPQGLTATVVLSESHIALHSWPEHGTLFVDMASCSGELASRRAFDRLCELMPHASVQRDRVRYGVAPDSAVERADDVRPDQQHRGLGA